MSFGGKILRVDGFVGNESFANERTAGKPYPTNRDDTSAGGRILPAKVRNVFVAGYFDGLFGPNE
jgi:hypothetical protein